MSHMQRRTTGGAYRNNDNKAHNNRPAFNTATPILGASMGRLAPLPPPAAQLAARGAGGDHHHHQHNGARKRGGSSSPTTTFAPAPLNGTSSPTSATTGTAPAQPMPTRPPLGALLRHLPTPELAEMEVAVRSILYVLCDNMCPVVRSLNEKRRQCVTDVRAMLAANGAEGELYGSGRTGLTACTSSDLDYVVVVDGTPSSPIDPKANDGMSAFYRTTASPTSAGPSSSSGGGGGGAKKRQREGAMDDEALFFEEGFDSEADGDDGSLRGPMSPNSSTSSNCFAMTRSQRRREMGPLVRQLISQAAQFRRAGSAAAPNAAEMSRGRLQTAVRHQQRYGTGGPPVFVGFKPIINAKVPLLKCTHRPTQLEVDLSFALDGARSSDYLIARLNSQRPQCLVAARGLIVLLKHLLHEADLNDPSVGGLGSFPLCLMVVWFLESEVHKNFPIELQGSYSVLLTRFFAYYGDTFDSKHYGIDCVGKEMFAKAASTVLMIKNPLDRSLNAASACSRYFSDVRPLFQRLNKAFMQAMAPSSPTHSAASSSSSSAAAPPAAPRLTIERLFRKAIAPDHNRRCYEAFAATLRTLGADACEERAKKIDFSATFLKSVLAPVTTRWGPEMVCEMEGIGLGTKW